MARDCRVILFVKYPHPGAVKTRLARSWGEDLVVDLYKAFVCDELKALVKASLPMIFCCDPMEPLEKYQDWLDWYGYYIEQEGDDLGQRMFNAFSRVFADGADAAILIGSDIPELSSDDILGAQIQLKKNEAVLAPCPDGGYGLIGFQAQALDPSFFTSIPWGTKKVARKTLEAFSRKKIGFTTLPPLHDMDIPKDLEFLAKRHPTGGPLHTMDILDAMGH